MDYDINNLSDEITVTVYPCLHAEYGWLSLKIDDPPSADGDYALIGKPFELTFKTRDRDAIATDLVATLRREQQDIRSQAELRANRIEEKIQSILAIEDKSYE